MLKKLRMSIRLVSKQTQKNHMGGITIGISKNLKKIFLELILLQFHQDIYIKSLKNTKKQENSPLKNYSQLIEFLEMKLLMPPI